MTPIRPSTRIVLDTNVVSELMRPEPDERVLDWVRLVPPSAVFTTAVTVAEVQFGLARLPSGRRRTALSAAADEVFAGFADHVLPFDTAAAGAYGDIAAERERQGAPISGFDAQIAAVCRAREASLATRNTSDFAGLDLDLIDPWTSGERSPARR